MNSEIEGQLVLRNSAAGDLRVRLEPWGEERVLEAAEALTVRYSGPVGRGPEIEHTADEVVIYGWEGSVMSFDNV